MADDDAPPPPPDPQPPQEEQQEQQGQEQVQEEPQVPEPQAQDEDVVVEQHGVAVQVGPGPVQVGAVQLIPENQGEVIDEDEDEDDEAAAEEEMLAILEGQPVDVEEHLEQLEAEAEEMEAGLHIMLQEAAGGVAVAWEQIPPVNVNPNAQGQPGQQQQGGAGAAGGGQAAAAEGGAGGAAAGGQGAANNPNPQAAAPPGAAGGGVAADVMAAAIPIWHDLGEPPGGPWFPGLHHHGGGGQGRRGRARGRRGPGLQSLLRLSAAQFLRTPDLAAAERSLSTDIPKTLFYELLAIALSAPEPRAIVVQLLLKHWPDHDLKVAEVSRAVRELTGWRFGGSRNPRTANRPTSVVPSLLRAYFSGFGNTVRPNLRCLDLRGANEDSLGRLREFSSFYTDPSLLRDGRYRVVLPIHYVSRRTPFPLSDVICTDWVEVFKKSPGFFKVSSLTMDFGRDTEMDIVDYLCPEFLEAFHLGRYRLHRAPTAEEAALDMDDPEVYDQMVMAGAANAAANEQNAAVAAAGNAPNVNPAAAAIAQHQMGAAAVFHAVANGNAGNAGNAGAGGVGAAGAAAAGGAGPANAPAPEMAWGFSHSSQSADPKASGPGLKWRLKLPSFDLITSLTISSESVIRSDYRHLIKKVTDSSGSIPNLVLIQSWAEVIDNLKNLKNLAIKYQNLRGHLKRMLSGSVTREHMVLMQRQKEELRMRAMTAAETGPGDVGPDGGEEASFEQRSAHRQRLLEELTVFRLRSLSLEGCVLDRRDFVFLAEFLAVQGASLQNLDLGLWNYRQNCDRVPPLLQHAKKLTSLKLHMSGKVDQRQHRFIPPISLRALARKCREDLPDLKTLYLPDFNLDAPLLAVDVINVLMGNGSGNGEAGSSIASVPRPSRISELNMPERVSRHPGGGGDGGGLMGGGGSLPFVGDLSRMPSWNNSKYKKFSDAFKKHLSEEQKRAYSASATPEVIKFSTSPDAAAAAAAARFPGAWLGMLA